MCESTTTAGGSTAQGQKVEGGGGQAQGQAGAGMSQATPQADPRMPPYQAQQAPMPQPPYPYPFPGGYAEASPPGYPPYPGAAWAYGAPPPFPYPPAYPPAYPPGYGPAGAMDGAGYAGHAGQGAGRAVHAAAGAAQPGQGAGMARMLDDMTGGSGLGSLVQMLDLDDRELWKGALIGAAAVLLLTNESVQNALFRSGVRARDAVRSGVDQVRNRAAAAGEAIRRAGEETHE